MVRIYNFVYTRPLIMQVSAVYNRATVLCPKKPTQLLVECPPQLGRQQYLPVVPGPARILFFSTYAKVISVII